MSLPDEPLLPAQMEIMEIVWEKGELAAVEVRQLLADGRELARETVRTMLERMEDKGWLKHRVVGRTFFYSAAVPRGHGRPKGGRVDRYRLRRLAGKADDGPTGLSRIVRRGSGPHRGVDQASERQKTRPDELATMPTMTGIGRALTVDAGAGICVIESGP